MGKGIGVREVYGKGDGREGRRREGKEREGEGRRERENEKQRQKEKAEDPPSNPHPRLPADPTPSQNQSQLKWRLVERQRRPALYLGCASVFLPLALVGEKRKRREERGQRGLI